MADIRDGRIDAVAAWDHYRVNRMMEDFFAYKGLFIERGILLATSNNGKSTCPPLRGSHRRHQDRRE